MRKSVSGFTIVELLVVITVIGILVAIASFGFTQVQSQQRDEKRRADINILATEMNKYFQDNGSYPIVCGSSASAWYRCTQIDTYYTNLGFEPVDKIEPSKTSLSSLQSVLPGIPDDFGDPTKSSDDFYVSQGNPRASTAYNYIYPGTYFVFSPDLLQAGYYPRFMTADGSSSFICYVAPVGQNYDGFGRPNYPHPFVLGYYSEADNAWKFFHSEISDEVNNLRWNNDNEPRCNSEFIG